MKNAIGAKATIYWEEFQHPEAQREYQDVYISFDADYDEELSEFDKWGVPDNEIFLYLTDEEELQDWKEGNSDGFVIVDYELVYDCKK